MSAYSSLFSIRRLWTIFAASMIAMFGTLLYFGTQIYQLAPPIPEAVQSARGATLFTGEQILRGQSVWQSMGGMEQGSVWGHGSYVPPDWSADWLHREALALLDRLSGDGDEAAYERLSAPDQARVRALAVREMRTNTYDPQSHVITVSNYRAGAIDTVGTQCSALFRAGSPDALKLREEYAFPVNAVLTEDESAALNAFFFWTAWAATTERPGDTVTYTSNWPHEPLVGNTPSGA